MHGRASSRVSWLALCWLLTPPLRAHADEPTPPVVSIALVDTLLLPGSYDVSIAEASLDAGRAAGLSLFVEVSPSAPFELGAHALVLQRDSDDPQLARSTLTHVGGHVGGAFAAGERLVLGAAVLVGWQMLDFRDAETSSSGLGLGLNGQVSFRLYHWVWLRGHAGLLWQPLGGHQTTDVTMPPTPFFGLGLALGIPSSSR